MTVEELNGLGIGKLVDTRGTACHGTILDAKCANA